LTKGSGMSDAGDPGGEKIVYLMRGLPSSGKSHTADRLAGASGLVCETDAYFYQCVGEDPGSYDYRADLLDEARDWNFERFREGIGEGTSPIVVDRGNSLAPETQRYARYAIDHGYRVELREPDSEWWQEIRVLLKYKRHTWPVLRKWAEVLALLSSRTHRVPQAVIERRMARWRIGLTVQDILDLDPRSPLQPSRLRATSAAGGRSVAANGKPAESAARLSIPGQAHLVTGKAGQSRASPAEERGRDALLFDESAGLFERLRTAAERQADTVRTLPDSAAGGGPDAGDWIFDGSEGGVDRDGAWAPSGLIDWEASPPDGPRER